MPVGGSVDECCTSSVHLLVVVVFIEGDRRNLKEKKWKVRTYGVMEDIYNGIGAKFSLKELLQDWQVMYSECWIKPDMDALSC